MSLRILQLTNRMPWPLMDGGAIGIHYYTQGYHAAGCRLTLLAMNTKRHFLPKEKWPKLLHEIHRFEPVEVDNMVKPLAAAYNLVAGRSYNIQRFVTKAYAAKLTQLLQEETYDVAHLDGPWVTPYLELIRKYSKAKVVMRMHNPEFRIWERLAQQAHNPLKRWYLGILAKQLRAFEQHHCNEYDLLLSISKEDEVQYQSLGCNRPMLLHPFGINVHSIKPVPYESGTTISLYHIGGMDWLPNIESVDWLLEKVWPLVHAQLPDIKLHLAGRSMPQRYYQGRWPNVIIEGEVPDATVFERDKSILLVPLLSGGGVRIKIFNGLAMAKMIITTSIGVEGIGARDKEHLLIADTPDEFAMRIIEAVRNPDYIRELGMAGRRLIEERYDKQQLMQQLLTYYRSVLNKQ